MCINFINKTDFFNTSDNSKVRKFNDFCEKVSNLVNKGKVNSDLTISNLAEIHTYLRYKAIRFMAFMELWNEEGFNKDIADFYIDVEEQVIIVAFVGNGTFGKEVVFYEF